MVEYNTNNEAPTNRNSVGVMFFVFLAVVVIVLGIIYLVPRLRGNTDEAPKDVHVQVDTPAAPTPTPTTGNTGTTGTTPTGTDTTPSSGL